MNTSFQMVAAMNTAFGNPQGNPLSINWDRVRKQCKNIPDEVGELFVALGASSVLVTGAVKALKATLDTIDNDVDVEGVRDALCDINVFACGAQHLMGVDGDRDMQSVIDGVMTRFVKDPSDLDATIAIFNAKGVTQTYTEGEFPTMILKSAVDQPDAPKGKFLKSASYQPTKFYELDEIYTHQWGCTSEQHVWENATTGKFHFSDEASLYDPTPYDTIEEAKAALDNYAKSL